MFRIAMTAVLLILAIGESSRLVCRVWCGSDVGITASCPHPQASSAGTISVGATCSPLDGEAAVFVREDGWRGPSALDPVPVLAVAAFQLPPPAAVHARLILTAATALPGATRPIIALRI